MRLAQIVLILAAASGAQGSGLERDVAWLVDELGLPADAVMADVGAGDGSLGLALWRARREGRVILEDVSASLEGQWRSRHPSFIKRATFVIGTVSDPMLPAGGCDLVVTRDALHEFTHPREMLSGIRAGLKPGGFLVVVDRYAGAPRDRTTFAEREEHHAFGAETTAARLAFDAGFVFHARSENRLDQNDARRSFTTIFRNPASADERPAALPAGPLDELLRTLSGSARVLLVAHDPSRDAAVGAFRAERPDAPLSVLELDVDEWRLPGEASAPPEGELSWRVVPTYAGVPAEPLPALDAALFVDSFHALIYDDVLLRLAAGALAEGAPVLVLERDAAPGLPRMETLHRRARSRDDAALALTRAGFTDVRVRDSEGAAGVYVLTAAAPARPPEPRTLLSSAGWAAVLAELPKFVDEAAVIGDDAGLTHPVFAAAGCRLIAHATAYGWEDFTGDASAIGAAGRGTPFPFAGRSGSATNPEADVVIVPEHERLPDPLPLLNTGAMVLGMPASPEGGLPVDARGRVLAAGHAWSATVLGAEELEGLAPGRAIWILALADD